MMDGAKLRGRLAAAEAFLITTSGVLTALIGAVEAVHKLRETAGRQQPEPKPNQT